jgi:hypothetical protein
MQRAKHDLEMVRIDEGIQIDANKQDENADASRVETRQPGSNITETRESHMMKHSAEIVSVSREIITSLSRPKYQIAQRPLKSIIKLPKTRKNGLPESTETLLMPDSASDKPLNSRTVAGSQIDRSEPQQPNADSPMVESLAGDSNVKCER